MYRIIQPDGKIFRQGEIGDNSDPHVTHTFMYKTWLKKGFIAAIRRYYQDATRARREDACQDLPLIRPYKQETLFSPTEPKPSTIICDVSICVQLQPYIIHEASKSATWQ